MKIKNFLSPLFLVFNCFALFAQEEYFVQVNPSTCSYTILDSIPIIRWISVSTSTFDKINRRYIFQSMDNSNNSYLCSIDASNGSTVSIPLMTSNFGGLKFDNSTGILYGIHWTTTLTNGADFVSINPANLSYSVIRQINLTSIGIGVTFDDINHRYILAASDSIGTQCLFSIDVATGNIISKPPLLEVSGIQFDNSSGNLYGLRWNNSLQTEYFVSVNITNGTITDINSIPLVIGIAMGYPTFDEINRRYTFRGFDNSNNNYLFTLDATNGQVVSNPLFPFIPPPGNLIETEYDNSSGNLYALHWGSIKTTTGLQNYKGEEIRIFPNPFSTQTTLEVDKNFKGATLSVFNTFGQQVKQIKNISGQTITLYRDNLPSGMYILRMTQDNKTFITDKLVIKDN